MRRIAVITGTRAEYGILKPVIDEIDFHPNLELQLVVTGMHLSPQCGMTVQHIEKDGLSIAARVGMLLHGDTPPVMGKSLGLGIFGLTQELERLQPHIVLVLGDRIEAFAGATAGLFCRALVAHIHGGELTRGGFDETMRHAITKLSHLHFAATEKARQRIMNMGEHPDFVYHTGSPGLDELIRFPLLSDEELFTKLGFALPSRFIFAVQHPISTNPENAMLEMEETLAALRESGLFVLLAYPNADAGNRRMIEVIERYAKEPWLKTYIHLPRLLYANVLRRAAVMAGNSSAGIIDTPSFGVPVVNIGERQEGREQGDNVLNVPTQHAAIAEAIQRALTDQTFIQQAKSTANPYGDGHAAVKIRSVLEGADLEQAVRCKRLPW